MSFRRERALKRRSRHLQLCESRRERYHHRPLLRDPRKLAELEKTLNDALRRFEHDAESMPARDALQIERLTAKARRDLRAMKEKIAQAGEGEQT